MLLRRVDAQFLDEPRVCVQHLELDAARVVHTLAARRDAAGKREDEAADGVDVLFLFGREQLMPKRCSSVSIGVRASAMRP